MGSGGHREITVNVEQVARNIDRDNSVHQAILLLGMAHASRLRSNSLGAANTIQAQSHEQA
jgi:hypothetical protein